MATFEERLRQLRKEKGLSQIELAEALNVANTTVSIWERGLRKPEMDTLEKVRKYFDVSLAYLLGENTGERTDEASVTFAQRLKELRVERGLTQEELAEKLGVTKNTIYVWEKGQRFPDDEWATYNELSIIFDVSYGYVAGDTDAYIDEGVVMDNGKYLFKFGLCLPSDNKMTVEEQDKVIEIVKRCFR